MRQFRTAISTRGFEASWGSVAREDCPRIVQDALKQGRKYILYGSEVELRQAAHNLECLGMAWMYDGQAENRREAKAMLADSDRILESLIHSAE